MPISHPGDVRGDDHHLPGDRLDHRVHLVTVFVAPPGRLPVGRAAAARSRPATPQGSAPPHPGRPPGGQRTPTATVPDRQGPGQQCTHGGQYQRGRADHQRGPTGHRADRAAVQQLGHDPDVGADKDDRPADQRDAESGVQRHPDVDQAGAEARTVDAQQVADDRRETDGETGDPEHLADDRPSARGETPQRAGEQDEGHARLGDGASTDRASSRRRSRPAGTGPRTTCGRIDRRSPATQPHRSRRAAGRTRQ